MQINRDDIDEAVKAKLISVDQAKSLWLFWQNKQVSVPQFRLSHVLYYFGGLLAISAVTLFVTQAWDQMRGIQLGVLTSLLFLLGCLLSRYFLNKKLSIPAGILSTFSLALVPLAVYNFQIWLGWLPHENLHYADFHLWFNWYWVPMELATIGIGFLMLYLCDFPFLLFPIAVALLYLSTDLFFLLFPTLNFSQIVNFSMCFGFGILLVALYLDFKYDESPKDYSHWLYIAGVMIFWMGLTTHDFHSELDKFLYCLINVVMILLSVFLCRRVFAVFGAFGVIDYLGHLSFSIFENSLGFPLVLISMGILIIFAGTRWSKAEAKLFEYLRPYMPKKILNRMQY